MHSYVTARKVAIPVNVAAKTWDLSSFLLVVFATVVVTDGCGRKPYKSGDEMSPTRSNS